MSKESKIGVLFSILTIISYFIAIGIVQQFHIESVDVKLILVASFFILLLAVIWLQSNKNKLF